MRAQLTFQLFLCISSLIIPISVITDYGEASNKLLEVFLELPYRKAYFFGDENAEHPTVTAVGDIPKVKIRQSGHFPMIDNPKEFYGELLKFISGANRI